SDSTSSNGSVGVLPSWYFCIAENDELLERWTTVEDRLFKIRNCLNIEGVASSLSLWEQPLDVGAFVKAAAAGVDLSSVLSDVNAPLPNYRFQVMLQKATELCGEVQSLGSG